MATIANIRGALLEEIVLYLLDQVGYKALEFPPGSTITEAGVQEGASGLELQGRGTWHQTDAVATLSHSPAFIHPIRLIVEAKCYQSKVGVGVVRNSVGVLKDINENHFSISGPRNRKIKSTRYNYLAAIFSSSGYSPRAIEYAIAHQIFLIEYQNIPLIEPIVNSLLDLDTEHLIGEGLNNIKSIRRTYRSALQNENIDTTADQYFSSSGMRLLRNIQHHIQRIGGSYFGMLQGRWPLHLLTEEPLPPDFFETDVVECMVRSDDGENWKFVPSRRRNDRPWFEIQFNLPQEVASIVAEYWRDQTAVANLKAQYFSYINLSGKIGNIHRTVKLVLDETWLHRYLMRQAFRE